MAHVVENVRKRQRMHTKDTAVLKHRLDGADGRECTKNAVEKRIREIESETPALSVHHSSDGQIGNDCH